MMPMEIKADACGELVDSESIADMFDISISFFSL